LKEFIGPFIKEISRDEENILFTFQFLIFNQEKIDLDLLKYIAQILSNFETDTAIAYRALLISNLRELPQDILANIKFDEKKRTEVVSNKIRQINKGFEDFNLHLLKTKLTPNLMSSLGEKLKPDKIKYLIITEGDVPEDINDVTYFYNSAAKTQSKLFLNIMQTIFPSFRAGLKPDINLRFLKEFSRKGFFILDIFPLRGRVPNREYQIVKWYEGKIREEIKKIIVESTSIIVIGDLLHRVIIPYLEEDGFNVKNKKPIPYPDHENSDLFRKEFLNLIRE